MELTTDAYDIVTRPGSSFIQNGGEDVRPGVISELNILIEDATMFGVYDCQNTI